MITNAASIKVFTNTIEWSLCQPTTRHKMLQRGGLTLLAEDFPEEMAAEFILLGWFDSALQVHHAPSYNMGVSNSSLEIN